MLGRIREATPEDVPELTRLCHQLGYDNSEDQTRQSLSAFQSQQDRKIIVCEADSGLAGWIGLRTEVELTSPPYLLISGFVVDERYRGQGYGKALLNHVRNVAKAQGLSKIRLRMNEKRTETLEFYRHAGFQEKKRQVVFEAGL